MFRSSRHVWRVPLVLAYGALLLFSGCTSRPASGGTGAAALPALVAQRVTATVKREALRLVRLETEHEVFLTTPEHPFATLDSGWIGAGLLVPGTWLVSERFGAVRVLSVRSEPVAQPVSVFNLSVAPSHAYWVGTERVLVHNTKCQSGPSESRSEAIERMDLARAELTRELRALTKELPGSPRVTELKLQRERLRRRLERARRAQRKEQGLDSLSRDERSRQFYELEGESTRKALEGTWEELAALEQRSPDSPAEEAALGARKAELERQSKALQFSHERAVRILSGLRELEQLETGAADPALEERRTELRANLDLERRRERKARHMRNRRADPEGRSELAEYGRMVRHRSLRSAVYLADTGRPRDSLELLEEELAVRLQGPRAESDQARIDHLRDQVDTMKRRIEVRRAYYKTAQRRYMARRARDKRRAKGADTREFDQKVEQAEREFHAVRVELAQLRVRGRLLAQLERTPWAQAPEPVDEARLREFARQLAESPENEQQLLDIERILDATAPTPAEWQAVVRDEADDVDEILGEREQLMRQSPSPERAVGLQSSYERLQQELRDERVAVEVALAARVGDPAFAQTIQIDPSSGLTWPQRLGAIQEDRAQLRASWRANLQARLDSALAQLGLMQNFELLRDEEIEAELEREIALLAQELQRAD